MISAMTFDFDIVNFPFLVGDVPRSTSYGFNLICYKYNKPIRNTVFNFNKLVSDLDIHANTPES